MKFAFLILASFLSFSSFASTLNCDAKLYLDNYDLEFNTRTLAKTEKFKQELEKGETFMNLIVTTKDLQKSFNFAVEVENEMITSMSIENENSRNSSGVSKVKAKALSYESYDNQNGSSLELNCEIK